jgi:hypothetical protein
VLIPELAVTALKTAAANAGLREKTDPWIEFTTKGRIRVGSALKFENVTQTTSIGSS